MKTETIELFDTTLRDGTQAEGINISVQDKMEIAIKLDEFGIDIIEGGWPGSNPRDEEFFRIAKQLNLKNAQMCAFGSTARSFKVSEDYNLNALLLAETPVISIFGKTWKLHVEKGLKISGSENAELIYNSVSFLKQNGRRVIYDAEHFFDGYKDDPEFALKMISAAQQAGADVITLCDTNGGSMPDEVFNIIQEISKSITAKLGIHTHNDSELAVANAISAIKAGAVHVQGTINGVGERCGNANLCSLIPNIILKMKKKTKSKIDLKNLTLLSNYTSEVMNLVPNSRAPFTGKSAFTHKGGIHVSAVLKDSRMYEHIEPSSVGNKQRVLVSDLAGQSNIKYKAKEIGIDIWGNKDLSRKLIAHIKSLEFEGYQFDGAEASFELLLHTEMNDFKPYFRILYSKVNVMNDVTGTKEAEAVLKVEVNGEVEHTASNGDGPVNALDNALRKALLRFYPEISLMKLIDYKVRVLDEKQGTSAKVRVLIQSSDGFENWTTVGVDRNIIDASLEALSDSINYKLYKINKSKVSQVI
ncbi:MAG: citramalate synthase [Bacteroidota bacterium]|nr:citramalate synthase [Bacteroidota bacterium]MDP4195658.1 citramalate synthase [Bacteroidota bacterium]